MAGMNLHDLVSGRGQLSFLFPMLLLRFFRAVLWRMIWTLPLTASIWPRHSCYPQGSQGGKGCLPRPLPPLLPTPSGHQLLAVSLRLPFPLETEAPGSGCGQRRGFVIWAPLWTSFQNYGTLSKKWLKFQTWNDYFLKGGILVCLRVFPYFFLNKSKPRLSETNILVNKGTSREKNWKSFAILPPRYKLC